MQNKKEATQEPLNKEKKSFQEEIENNSDQDIGVEKKEGEEKVKVETQAKEDKVEEGFDQDTESKKEATQEKFSSKAVIQKLEEKFLRLQADFVNFQRRMAREKAEWMFRANQKMLLNLLPVVNDFGRALDSVSADEQNETIKGVLMIHSKLLKVLEKQGVEPMAIKAGSLFKEDDDKIEVISRLPVKDPTQKEKIVQVVEQGYLFDKKILQRAKVIIGI